MQQILAAAVTINSPQVNQIWEYVWELLQCSQVTSQHVEVQVPAESSASNGKPHCFTCLAMEALITELPLLAHLTTS